MLNKIKQIFNKKVLAFSLFLILSIAGAVGFVFSDKKEVNSLPLNVLNQEIENLAVVEQDFLALTVVNEAQPKVSKTANNAENGNWNETEDKLNGGEDITITNESDTVLGKTFTPNAGYEHTGFKIYADGNATGTPVFIIVFGTSGLTVTNGSGTPVTSSGTISVSGTQFKCKPEDIITSGYSSDNNKIFIK